MRIGIEINDDEIADVAVHNTGIGRISEKREIQRSDNITEPDVEQVVETKYAVYDLRHADIESKPVTFDDMDVVTHVWHDESNGATELAALVMDELDGRAIRPMADRGYRR